MITKDADELIKIYRQVPADLVNIIDITRSNLPGSQNHRKKLSRSYLENKVNARLRRSRRKISMQPAALANKGN
jgi:23S rRNA (adenine2503-C2)-methyltransferase